MQEITNKAKTNNSDPKAKSLSKKQEDESYTENMYVNGCEQDWNPVKVCSLAASCMDFMNLRCIVAFEVVAVR